MWLDSEYAFLVNVWDLTCTFHLENALGLNTALLFSHWNEQNQEDIEEIIYELNL